MKRILSLLLLLSLGLLLVACGGEAEPAAPPAVVDEPAVVEEAPAEEVAAEADEPMEEMVEEPTAEPMEEPTAEVVEEPVDEMVEEEPMEEMAEEVAAAPEPVPTLRVGMQASNPADFQLASGEIQLVEFFAFW